MRKLIVSSLLATALLISACEDPDPNRFETHIERIKKKEERSTGFTGLERLTKTIVTAKDNDDLLQEFADKVIPVFEEVWEDAGEQQKAMLLMLRDVGHPAGAPIWKNAIGLDGSTDAKEKTLLALQGTRKARATEVAPVIVEQLGALIKDPSNDQGEGKEDGKVRALMAATLGDLGDKAAVPVLVEALRQPQDKQPTRVHNAAAVSAGLLRDPAAIDALLEVNFRVRERDSTTNVAQRSKIALARIGEPAVAAATKMLKGEHDSVNKLTAEVARKTGGEQTNAGVLARAWGAVVLGAIGSKTAVDDLIAQMPTDSCSDDPLSAAPAKKVKKKKSADDGEFNVEAAMLRAQVAQALGFIGDPKGVKPVCSCINATQQPLDTFPMIEALGRMGGPEAVACLNLVVEKSSYPNAMPDHRYEPRWEAARYAVLAATPAELPSVKAAIATNKDPSVVKNMEQWAPGIAALEECKQDIECYRGKLKDSQASWVVREKAAFEVARLKSGDVKIAEELARAFKVPKGEARLSIAWLVGSTLDNGATKCPACVDAFNAVLEAENLVRDAQYMGSVLMVRATIAKIAGAGQSAPGDGKTQENG